MRKDFSRSSALVRFTVGVLMARREARAYARLDGVAGVPRLLARPAADALLLERIEGLPCVGPAAGVTQAFFDDLDALLVPPPVARSPPRRREAERPRHSRGPRSPRRLRRVVRRSAWPARSEDGSSPSPPATTNARSRDSRTASRRISCRLRAGLVDAVMPFERGVRPLSSSSGGRAVVGADIPRGPRHEVGWRTRLRAAVLSPPSGRISRSAGGHRPVLALTLDALPLTDPDEVFYAQTAREMLARRAR